MKMSAAVVFIHVSASFIRKMSAGSKSNSKRGAYVKGTKLSPLPNFNLPFFVPDGFPHFALIP